MALALASVDTLVLLWLRRPLDFLVLFAAAIALAALMLSSLVRHAAGQGMIRGGPADPSFEGWCILAVFAAFLAFYGATRFPETAFNEQVLQAAAFLHGHTYIDPPSHIEHAEVGPYKYALHPPLPAIILMPLVSIWGTETPQTALSVFVGAMDVALVWWLLGELALSISARVWLVLFFGAGTVFWYETVIGTTWALPMVVSVFFTLAALIEVFGRARPLWLGAFAGLASLARYDLVLTAPVFAALAYLKGRRVRELLWMLPGFAAVGVVFVAFNEARFQSFFDVGVMLTGPKGRPAFSLGYLPGNLYTVFFLAPAFDDRFPYLHPTFMGQALTLTSPAFVLAFRASFRRAAPLLMLLAAILGSVPSLLCYANGYAQFGTRHYIQVFPFLLVMMALGMPRRTDQLTKLLTVVSMALVAFGVWHIHVWGFG